MNFQKMFSFLVLLSSGTTLAISGEDFALVAGCTRMSTGYEILSRNQSKLFHLTGGTVLAAAGCHSDIVTMQRFLSARLTQYEHAHGKEMSTSAAAQLLCTTLYSRRFFPYYAFCMLAGMYGFWLPFFSVNAELIFYQMITCSFFLFSIE